MVGAGQDGRPPNGRNSVTGDLNNVAEKRTDSPARDGFQERSPGPMSGVVPVETFPDAATTGMARRVLLQQPGQILFGDGCSRDLACVLQSRRLKHLLVITSPTVHRRFEPHLAAIRAAGLRMTVYDRIRPEPTVADFEACLTYARMQSVDGIVGVGGGSPLDVAKLVAALIDGRQGVQEVFGGGQVLGRRLFLACVPTTAGTGSEVSPNAVLLDVPARMKKAAISPFLVPDVACVDPLLGHTLSPETTAATGLDALTHCIEGFANRNAHPVVDLHALEGVRLIGRHLLDAVRDGSDNEARAGLALGSLHGGLCLGPVNTAAVHALAYPLGCEFGVGHGVSNAVLLPHVLRWNLPAAPERYARIALALGVSGPTDESDLALAGVERLAELLEACPIPRSLSELGVSREALPGLARSAMTVKRLLKNNPRPMTEEDALGIYRSAF